MRASETSGSPQPLMQVTSANGTIDQSDEVNPSPHKSSHQESPTAVPPDSELSPQATEVRELPQVENWAPRHSSAASDKKGATPGSEHQGSASAASERKGSSSEVDEEVIIIIC